MVKLETSLGYMHLFCRVHEGVQPTRQAEIAHHFPQRHQGKVTDPSFAADRRHCALFLISLDQALQIARICLQPHKCPVCGKAFSRRPHMLEHERYHRNDYKFRCNRCGRGYNREKLFRAHNCKPRPGQVREAACERRCNTC